MRKLRRASRIGASLKGWFASNMPAVKTVHITPRESWVDDPDMRAKVAANGDAAILGVGN